MNAKLRMRLVVIFFFFREELKAVLTGQVNWALYNDSTGVYSYSRHASMIEHESLKQK